MKKDAPLMLSVSGARGIVGESLTPALAADFAAAFGSFIKASTGEANPIICLGRDSRPSGSMVAAAAAAGLAAVGCRVIHLGVVATPTVGVMVTARNAQGGMVATASHNPIQWNGIKCLNAQGMALPQQDIEQVITRFKQHDLNYNTAADFVATEDDGSANQQHVNRVLKLIDPAPIREAKLKVVLDSVNGAGCESARMLLDALQCNVVHLNGAPTGHFAHTPEPTKENLTDLATQTADAANVACGFAQDPDADRLAIVDENGRYIGEEYTLVLAARRMLELRGSSPLAANLSTSRMIDDLAARHGATVHRTAVGEANVATAMQEHGALIGGEGNGGVIVPGICWVRDSLSAMALVLSLIVEQGRPFSEIVKDTPPYAMIKSKFDLTDIGGRDAVAPALTRVTQAFADERINDADGVRIDFAEGWVHIRPSNTEPILRLIAEAEDVTRAQSLIAAVLDAAGLSAPA